MLHDKSDGVFINEPFSLLAGVHQALFADAVNHPGNSGGSLLDHIHRNIREKIRLLGGEVMHETRLTDLKIEKGGYCPANHKGELYDIYGNGVMHSILRFNEGETKKYMRAITEGEAYE